MVDLTTQFDFIETLTAQLLLRAGLADVQVISGPIDLDTATKRDIIQLFGTEMTETFAAIGNKRHEETYTLEGELIVVRPPAGETGIQEVRDRAKAIFGELETELRTNHKMNGTVKWCRLSSVAIAQGYGDKGRICVVSFTITAFASLGWT